MIKTWNKLPETVRWVLFLPAFALCIYLYAVLLALASRVLPGFGAPLRLAASVIIAWTVPVLLFALAPRWKSVIAGIVCAMIASAICFGIIALRSESGFLSGDWFEILKAAVLLVVGAISFQDQVKRLRINRTALHSPGSPGSPADSLAAHR